MVYFINSGISQGARDFVSLKNFTPPSPESIAMQKYGDVPVDLSAGIVQVSVPIYEIKSRQLSSNLFEQGQIAFCQDGTN